MILLLEPRIVDNSLRVVCLSLLSEPRIVDNSVCSVIRKWNDSAPRTQNCRQFSPLLLLLSLVLLLDWDWDWDWDWEYIYIYIYFDYYLFLFIIIYYYLLISIIIEPRIVDNSVCSVIRKWNDSARRTQNGRQFSPCRLSLCSPNPELSTILFAL